MSTLALELSPDALRRLERYAADRGVKPQDAAREILERALGDGAGKRVERTERIRIRSVLRKAGLTRGVSKQLVRKYVRVKAPVEREAMRRRLRQKRFDPLLSEIIIEDRGKR